MVGIVSLHELILFCHEGGKYRLPFGRILCYFISISCPCSYIFIQCSFMGVIYSLRGFIMALMKKLVLLTKKDMRQGLTLVFRKHTILAYKNCMFSERNETKESTRIDCLCRYYVKGVNTQASPYAGL